MSEKKEYDYNYLPKRIKDPIHGYMEFDPWVMEFIDTPEFQRLRNLKQLGTTYHVFPGASHNRFEHSLGTAHLANNYLKKIYEAQPELKSESEKDLECVTLAGLCHDLGHGPFSHIFDIHVVPRISSVKWTHEEASQMMLQHLIDKNEPSIDLDGDDIEFIKSLITGKVKSSYSGSRHKFLFDIVSNDRNSIDVDKFDYLDRDCYHLGMKSSFDSSRLMKFSRVIDDEICYKYKESYNIYDLFHTRYSLFKKVYCHPVGVAISEMVADALIEANHVLKLEDSLHDPEKYLELDDSILEKIYFSKAEGLTKSKKIIKRIKKRDLYKLADEMLLPNYMKDHITRDKVEQLMYKDSLSRDDFAVCISSLNYCKKDKNPVNSVRFYNKYEPDEAFGLKRNQISFLAPEQFQELVIRIYAKNNNSEIIQKAFRKVMKENFSSPDNHSLLTIPLQQQPSPVLSQNLSFNSGYDSRSVIEFSRGHAFPDNYHPKKRKRNIDSSSGDD